MEIKIEVRPLFRKPAPSILILGHYEGAVRSMALQQADKITGGIVQEAFSSESFSGKFLTTTLLNTGRKEVPRLLLLGLGREREITPDKIRAAIGTAAPLLREAGGQPHCAIALQGISSSRIATDICAQAIVEGILLALYRFDLYKTDQKEPPNQIKTVSLMTPNRAIRTSLTRGALHGQWIAEAVNATRNLCNHPANVITPSRLAEEAMQLKKEFPLFSVQVLERADAQKLGMGAYTAVAQGTAEPPKFIVLEYRGSRKRPIALVGKSVTFDSGGISLKSSDGMEHMKYDMSGGAAVLGALKVAAQMQLPLHIVGILPATDNMPSGQAIHPGDVVRTLSGKTVEIANTDAEGRLCLADAITYALRYKPHTIIDLATLTGACVVALGHHAAALFSNDLKLRARIEKAAEKSGEKVWSLPLWEEYRDQIKSDVADLKNTGGRPAGSITAALFLKEFAKDVSWAHLDIAGVAWNDGKPRVDAPKGATGAGVRLLVRYLIDEVRS